jgi:hypothetical protein
MVFRKFIKNKGSLPLGETIILKNRNYIITKIINIIIFISKQRETNFGIRVYKYSGLLPLYLKPLEVIYNRKPAAIRYRVAAFELFADPFIISFDSNLFCFYEVKTRKDVGKIMVAKINQDHSYYTKVCNLGVNEHVSFPFVFKHHVDASIYMIPETAAKNEVAIYEPTDFPTDWVKKATLLYGNYVDSHIYFNMDTYYLFTTKKIKNKSSKLYDYHLCIFSSKNLFGPYSPHPLNPISVSKKHARSGGAIIKKNNCIYRVAQDCSKKYGRDLNFFEIKMLSAENYQEKACLENWINCVLNHELGGHHISECEWNQEQYIAVDLHYKDGYIQRFIKRFLK